MQLLNEKYRPKSVKDILIGKETKDQLLQMVKDRSIPNLLLYNNVPGTGKTTIAHALVNDLEAEYLYINASADNSIDNVRESITRFCQTRGLSENKIIILDEADYITKVAQSALRGVMENYSDNVRFILTCNYVNRIITPLHSRCTAIEVTPPDIESVAMRLYEIAVAEKIKATPKDIVKIVKSHFPDVRRSIETFKSCIIGDELKYNPRISLTRDELFNAFVRGDSFMSLRNLATDNSKYSYDAFFDLLVEKIDTWVSKEEVSYAEAIIIISEHQYRDTQIFSNKHINVLGMLSKLSKLRKNGR